jgi:hypothetical protein
MKKNIAFFFVFNLFGFLQTLGQDYIITLRNDTIPCKLPGTSKEIGLKPAREYENGYEKIVAIFSNDSIRVLKANEIKGYSRQKHGKKLLCDGFFEAKQIVIANSKKRTIVDQNKNSPEKLPWYFMNRIIEGKYASLYSYYFFGGPEVDHFYYISRSGIEAPNTVIPFFNRKKMVELLSEEDIASEMQKFKYKKSMKGVQEIVNEYNRLKEIAAEKLDL